MLNTLNTDFDYSILNTVDRIYVPLKYFINKDYANILNTLSSKCKLYIYLPVIIKDRFFETIKNAIQKTYNEYDISGFVVSELASLNILKDFKTDLIANYNFNIYNSYTAQQIQNLGFSHITLSPELDENEIENIELNNKEVIVYGKIPLMTMSYCPLGKSNRCYKECKHLCNTNNKFYLNDRYKFNFRVIPDNIQTLTTIFNSRNIELKSTNSQTQRFDFLDETIEEINKIIS